MALGLNYCDDCFFEEGSDPAECLCACIGCDPKVLESVHEEGDRDSSLATYLQKAREELDCVRKGAGHDNHDDRHEQKKDGNEDDP